MINSHNKPEIYRRTNAEDIKTVWECIRNTKIQKQTATFDKLIKSVAKETDLNDESSKRLIMNLEADGLIERVCNQAMKGANINGPYANGDFFTLPDFSKSVKKGEKDWYCFICHLAGEVISCQECFRSFHSNCYKDHNQHKSNNRQHFNRFNKTSEKFVCYICESKNESRDNFSRKQIRKLLDFATHFIRKKSSWKDMSTIGFRGEIVKNEYLVFRYCDLELIQRKIRDGRYNYLTELIEDAENFVHCVCILHGIYSDKADQARVLLREMKDEISEVQLCADCYINAKAKLAEWITKPCQPNHKQIWSKQAGTPYFWPAKLLTERNDGYEIRFFGGNHDRAFVKRHETKSFHFRPEEVEIKTGSGFDRAWTEVKKLREKIEQGYYTHSSGESDLPGTEDDYSDEIYLSERRTSGLSITDHNLANGSNYSLLNSLSSRRSTALERSRKSTTVVSPGSMNGKLPGKGPVVPSVVSSERTGVGRPSKTRRRPTSRPPGGPSAKRAMGPDKSISSYRSTSGGRSAAIAAAAAAAAKKTQHKHSASDSDSGSNDSENESEKSTSSSENIKSLNYKFSPKSSILRSPGVSSKSLRQNRKPSAKLSQLSASRYTSLSDRIKMDLSSTESSEFDPKDDRIPTRKRTRKKSLKAALASTPVGTPSSKYRRPAESVTGIGGRGSKMVGRPRKESPSASAAATATRRARSSSSSSSSSSKSSVGSRLSEPAASRSSNENTDRCCSPDTGLVNTTSSPLFRSKMAAAAVAAAAAASSGSSKPPATPSVTITPASSKQHLRGVAPADSTSNSLPPAAGTASYHAVVSTTPVPPLTTASTSGSTSASAAVTPTNQQQSQPLPPSSGGVSTTSPYPHRQRINSGYNPVFMGQPTKRMVHKCVATTMPVCNCQEKFDKKLEEEKQKLQREHQQILVELEKKLKLEFEDIKTLEVKKTTDEVKSQMQELIDKEKLAAQEALTLAEAKHSEAVTNTKRRQWCRNCLKEAIYHCCWNTSYCSIQCQQEHWQKEHKRVCRRKR